MKFGKISLKVLLLLVLFSPSCGEKKIEGDRTCSGSLVSESETFLGSIANEKSCFYNNDKEQAWSFSKYELSSNVCTQESSDTRFFTVEESISLVQCQEYCTSDIYIDCLSFSYQKPGAEASGVCTLYDNYSIYDKDSAALAGVSPEFDFKWCFSKKPPCDEDLPETTFTYYLDADKDRSPADETVKACSPPSDDYVLVEELDGRAPFDIDCDDSKADYQSLATYYQDADKDKVPSIKTKEACSPPNDNYVLASELTGLAPYAIDCDDSNASYSALASYYLDADGDLEIEGTSVEACSPPSASYVLGSTLDDLETIDCDDSIANSDCSCGDGNLDIGEECDDGGIELGDGCTDTCYFEFSALQVGDELYGEAGDDTFGLASSLSLDGTVLAVGAPYNDGTATSAGHVRVFEQTPGSGWSQRGDDIDGEANGDISGNSVSLSNDGDLVAIGAKYNDASGAASGQVRVYEWADDSWSQKGADLDGDESNDLFGESISFSGDGTLLAVGAPYGAEGGFVRFFKYSEDNWVQVGDDIDDAVSGDELGFSVSLSSDGTFVAVGVSSANGGDKDSGLARVYKRPTGDTGPWTQVGDDILGEGLSDATGHFVSLSSDGTIIAVSAPEIETDGIERGYAKVFQYSSAESDWVQLGQTLIGEYSGDQFSESLSLSNDGTVLAVGAHYNGGGGSGAGQTRVFEYKPLTQTWVQLGIDFDGEAGGYLGSSVALSGDGKRIAMGAPWDDGGGSNYGMVSVFKFQAVEE